MLSTVFRRTSLSTKVGLLSLTLCFISVLVLAKYAQEKLTADLTRTTGAQLASAAAYAAQDVSLDLATQLTAIQSSARLIVADDLSGSLRNHSQAMQALFDTGFVAVMANGAVTYPPSPNPASEGLAWVELESVRAALSGVGSPIGLIDIASGPHRKAIAFAAAIRDNDHRIVGALVGLSSSTESHVFNPLLQKAYGQAGVFVILDQARGVLGERSSAQARLSIARPALMDRRTLWPSCGGRPTEIGSGRSTTLVAGAKVQSTDWCVVVALPLEEILGQYQALNPGVYWRAFYLSLPFGLLTFWAMRRVLTPLSQAIAGLDAIDITDPHLTGIPDTGVGEVHTLLSSVNILLRALKQREHALWESQALFRAFADTSPVLIVQTRGSSPLGEKRITERTEYINPAFTAILGYTLEDVPTTGDVYARMFPDPAEYRTQTAAWEARVTAALDGHTFEPLSAWCAAKDGSRKFLSWQRVVSPGDQHWAFGLDLTSSQVANESLRLFQRAVEQSPVMISITDRHANLVYVNPRLEEATGYSREELMGQNPRIFSGGAMPRDTVEAMYEELQAGRDFHCEVKNRKKDGTVHEVSLSISAIFDDQNTLINFIGIKEDISERNRTAALLIDAGLNAERASRAKSAFVSNVSHELRTPLSTVQGYIEMFDSGSLGELNAPQQAALQVMKRNLTRLIDLITEMIEFSRMEIHGVTVTHTLFSPGRLIREAAAAIHPNTLVKNISVNVFIPEDFPCAWGDQGKLSQVLGILCSNAVKFTSHGGLIRIAAERHALHTLAISVSDTGIGIAAEHLEKIFQKFYQVDSSKTRRYEGAGIGLSIAKSIMDAHHGHIHVTSQTGQGTTFTLLFPDALFDEMDLLSMPPDDRQISLVMIDETGELDESILGLLGRLSYRTHSATNVYECIRYAEKNKVDLILLNDTRPDLAEMMNIETLRHNPATEVTPMLILTASRTIKLREASRVWDDCFMLPKPFTAVTLVAHIQHIALGKALPFHLEDMMKKELVVYERPRVMVVDEDPGMLDLMQILLHQQQYPFEGARNLHQALELAQDFPPAILFLDGDMDAEEMQRRVQFIEQSPALLQAACYTLGSPPKSADSLPFAGSLQKPPNPAELRKILIKHTHFTQT